MKENFSIGASLASESLYSRIQTALHTAVMYGQIDGEHHKQWVINQIIRNLLGNNPSAYEKLVNRCKAGEDGPDTYGWEEGIPP